MSLCWESVRGCNNDVKAGELGNVLEEIKWWPMELMKEGNAVVQSPSFVQLFATPWPAACYVY